MVQAGARQLALALSHQESFARADFMPAPSNAAALALIERWPDWPAPVLALVGPEGSGKSHLAAVWAEEAGARFMAGRALRPAQVPAALATGALVLEDLTGGQFDERALFHLLNLAREEDAFVLFTATMPPAAWATTIADLGSRLRALPVATLGLPDDGLLRAVLLKLFADRQLAVDEGLLSFLTARMERSLATAKRLVARLDQESLRLRRPVSRALAMEVLNSA